MRTGPLFAALLATALTATAAGRLSAGHFTGLEGHPDLRSASALVLDPGGKVIYAKDAETVRSIASITKLMTAMVVLDAGLDLEEAITVTKDDRDSEQLTGSRLGYGASLSRREMILLALMSSENRAAAALGRTWPGGLSDFVAQMNRKAAELGMTRSRFADPAGLSADNRSTAADLGKMVIAADGYPLIREATTTRSLEVRPWRDRGPLTYVNTNRLLKNATWDIELSKTGYINEAGRCLVMRARIDGEDVSIVLLNSFGKLTPFGDSNRLRKWLLAKALDSCLVAAFYRFVALPDYRELRAPLQQRCEALGLLGTILLAEEGINGTVSGAEAEVRRLFETLAEDLRFASLAYKESRAAEQPFYRMKVRLKKEIVSLGVDGVDPSRSAGRYVTPAEWNALISRPDVRVIDTRNDYEHHLGSFRGAEDPHTRSFRDFPEWVAGHLDPAKDRHVAMFCTGGIRCEKATSYLLNLGFENVYHLEGGILNYLEQIGEDDSLWEGECFVFDNRVTVDHDLAEGDYEVCPACRMPLTEADRASPLFELHVSCPKCHHRLTEARREGLLERARQIELAEARGERHIGARQPERAERD